MPVGKLACPNRGRLPGNVTDQIRNLPPFWQPSTDFVDNSVSNKIR